MKLSPSRILLAVLLLAPATPVYAHENAATCPAVVPLKPAPTGDNWPVPPFPGHPDEEAGQTANAATSLAIPLTPAPTPSDNLPVPPFPGHPDEADEDAGQAANAATSLAVPLTPAPTPGDNWPVPPFPGHPDEVDEDADADESDVKKRRRCFCGPKFESMPPTISQCIHISCAPDDWWNGTNIRRWLCSPYELSDSSTPKFTLPHPEPTPRAVLLYTGLLKSFNVGVLTATLVEVCKRPWRIRMANGRVDRMKYFNLVFGIVWGCIIMWGWTR